MIDIRTINDILLRIGHRDDATVAMYRDGSDWKNISSRQLYGRVRALVELLQSWGIQRGDRVALVSENRWEWPVVDFAILAIGAVDVPLYQTLTPEQMGYSLRDSGCKAIFLSTKQQFEKLVNAGEIPTLERVSIFDSGDFPNTTPFADIMRRAPELEQPDAAFDALVAETTPEDLATIVYTSGTTGDPKGVMLTHNNLAQNLRHSTDGLRIQPGYKSISFLPLSHALARHLDYAIYALDSIVAYLPKFDDLAGAMKAVHPEVFIAVPRVYEKVRQGVEHKSSQGLKKTIFTWALAQGAKHRSEISAGRTPSSLTWKIADHLVFSKIREAFGGQVKVFVSGGAPLGPDTTNWFLDVGIRIFEGYGLTETSPVLSRNTFNAYRPGTVGQLIPNIEARIAPDGEIEVHGTSVFSGYWQKDEATKKEFTDDGWFKTGDIGKIEDGFLSITDRKKELLKTSGGKYIAPQPIEGKLKADALVSNAAVVGDMRKYASVIISPNLQALERWAQQNGVSKKGGELAADPKVQQQYEAVVKKVNATLEHHETLKKVIVVKEEWTVDSGELTPSMKLKRRVILDKYKDEIENVYRGGGGE